VLIYWRVPSGQTWLAWLGSPPIFCAMILPAGNLFVCAAPFDLRWSAGYPSISHQVSKPRPNHPLNKQCQLLKLLKHPKNIKKSSSITHFFHLFSIISCNVPIIAGKIWLGPSRGGLRAPAGSKSVHCLAELPWPPWPPWPPWGKTRPFDPPPQVPNGDQPQNAGHSLVAETMFATEMCTRDRDIHLIS
jgi:hypothetical protein